MHVCLFKTPENTVPNFVCSNFSVCIHYTIYIHLLIDFPLYRKHNLQVIHIVDEAMLEGQCCISDDELPCSPLLSGILSADHIT